MAKRKRGYRTPQMHTTLRAGEQPGTYEVSLALGALEAPEREFYCATARVKRRPNFATFVFGQYLPGTTMLRNIVGIDVPYRSLKPIANTFDDSFREHLRIVTRALSPMERIVTDNREVQALSLSAHLARIVINDFGGVIDFFEMEPTLGSAQPVNPVIRIKSLPAVVAWFVDTVDAVVKELSSPPSVETNTEPEKAP